MPSSTPRSLDTIVNSIITTIGDINPQIDIRKGPIAVNVWALANELARSEEFTGYLSTLYSFENAEQIENSDLVLLGANYGKDPNVGRAARTVVHAFRYARPELNKTYPINIGTLFSTQDGRFSYSSVDTAIMNGNYADVYYNPTDQRYEIPVLVEAVAVGADYDLPPQTITRILGGLEDFDGCVNKSYAKRQGNESVAPSQFIRQLQNTMQGIGTDLAGNIITILQDQDPTGYDDIAFVSSLDYSRFKRTKSLHGNLGYDIYVISESVEEYIQSGFAKGGEIEIPLDRGPVLSVQWVTVNGSVVPFNYSADLNPQFSGSPLAVNKVVLTSALLPLQTYQISYIYYDFISNSYDLFRGRTAIFGTDVLVRKANPVEVYIDAETVALSSADRQQLVSDLRSFTSAYFRDPTGINTSLSHFYTVLDPYVYRSAARSSVNGLSDLKIRGFIRMDRASLPVERITFDGATEYPILSINSVIS